MNTYLHSAKLSGFRTIRNVEVAFKPGLNVIIGKNGSGKTNFISFLERAVDLDFKQFVAFNAQLEFAGAVHHTITASREFSPVTKDAFSSKSLTGGDINLTLTYDDKETVGYESTEDLVKQIGKKSFDSIQFIPHGIPAHFNIFINTPFSFGVDLKNSYSDELILEYDENERSLFINSLIKHLFISLVNEPLVDETEFSQRKLELNVKTVFQNFVRNLNANIDLYLPIKEVRLNPSHKLYHDIEKGLVKFEGLIFDFNVNGSWLPFSSLSDGTKRLFYLFAEMSASNLYESVVLGEPARNKIILLEEPELGIHPHQFHLIMDFIKDVATRNQVIITTHAPQALDALSKEELDAIHICSFNAEEGTTIKKLNANQIEKARSYMEEMYLSDYWIHSNLEDRK